MRPRARMLRHAAHLALAVALLAALPADAAPRRRPRPGPNLLPNARFEQSAIEGSVIAPGSAAQPLLPTGWAFEGSAGLFDHTPNHYRSGKRSIAISTPASGKRRVCQNGYCADNPANVKDAAAAYYSVTPHWRTLNPVAIRPKAVYRLTVFVSWDLQTVGAGASTKIRWLDANGLPIAESRAVPVRAHARNSVLLRWTRVTMTAKAPRNAKTAHVLLGNTDDAWISQIRYDDAYFGIADRNARIR